MEKNVIIIDGIEHELTDEAVQFLRGLNVQEPEPIINESTPKNELYEYYSMGDRHVGVRDPKMREKANEYKKKVN